MFMNISNVKILTKSKEILIGDLVPVEDFQEIKQDIPGGQFIDLMIQKQTGVLLMTEKGLKYLSSDEIDTMSSLRVF